MRTLSLLLVTPALLFVLLTTACNGKDGTQDARKKCYDDYGACVKGCEDEFIRKLEENADKLNRCNALQVPAARDSCMKVVLQDFKRIVTEADSCRNQCARTLQECLSKL